MNNLAKNNHKISLFHLSLSDELLVYMELLPNISTLGIYFCNLTGPLKDWI